MKTVKPLVAISGTRDGMEWPGLGGTINVSDGESAALAAAGLAVVVEDPKVERAVVSRKPETATRKTGRD